MWVLRVLVGILTIGIHFHIQMHTQLVKNESVPEDSQSYSLWASHVRIVSGVFIWLRAF
jgi:hypothetical protein